ncbi:hypothetical protein [Cecembia rubra]|nr:hypothetical protein [Cecembia rubra]
MKVTKFNLSNKGLSFWDAIIEILALVALVLLWVLTYSFQQLGSKMVSDNFDFFQNPSEYWASKMTYTLPIIASIFYLGITFFGLSRDYSGEKWNENPEKAKKLKMINQRLWRWSKFILVLMFMLIEYFSFQSGSNFGTGIPKWHIVVFPLLIFGPVIYFFLEFSKYQLDD